MQNDSWQQHFRSALQHQRESQRLRTRGGWLPAAPSSARNPLIDFGSNDYLGLSNHPDVLSAIKECTRFGNAASPVLRGHSDAQRQLETMLAELSGSEDCLLFNCGYSGHSGTVACLASDGDVILSDALNHACLIDGCRLSKAQTVIFPHADLNWVRQYLEDNRQRFDKALLITESVFGMDGDQADLTTLAQLSERFECGLVVDEAHATGIYGQRGGGMLEEQGVSAPVLAKLGTCSKALGGSGGFVCGSAALIEFLTNHCRSYLFSTAPSEPVVRGIIAAVETMSADQAARQTLRASASQLRRKLQEAGFELAAHEATTAHDCPIIPILFGTEEATLAVSQFLFDNGIYVPAIRPPTVPEGLCRLRLSLSHQHTSEQIDFLLGCLRRFRQHVD